MSILKNLMMLTLVLGTFDVSVHFAQEAEAVGYVAQANSHVFNGHILNGYNYVRLNDYIEDNLQRHVYNPYQGFVQQYQLHVRPISNWSQCDDSAEELQYAIRDYLLLPNNVVSGNVAAFYCKANVNNEPKDILLIVKIGEWRNDDLENLKNVYTISCTDNLEDKIEEIINGVTFNTTKGDLVKVTNQPKNIVTLFNINRLLQNLTSYFVALRRDTQFDNHLPLTHLILSDEHSIELTQLNTATRIADCFNLYGVKCLIKFELPFIPKTFVPVETDHDGDDANAREAIPVQYNVFDGDGGKGDCDYDANFSRTRIPVF